MPITINSNIASLNAQGRLGRSNATLQKSLERLSSGIRVNRASDDAAGLAVASSLRVDSRVSSQGVRNVNDALSSLQIAEGAMTSLSSIVTRIEELASQAANGTISTTQRQALDNEAQALKGEYARIVSTTQFNGSSLLSGQSSTLTVQAGGNSVDFATPNLMTGLIADGTFNARTSIATGTSPAVRMIHDFNNDGIADLATTSGAANNFDIRFGNGDGSFNAAVSFATSGTVVDLTSSDFNRDGVIDIVTADWASKKVSIFLGNSDGTFKAGVTYATATNNFAAGVDVGDFNGDGLMDLVTSDAPKASVLLGNGDGTFKVSVSFASHSTSDLGIVGDYTGDGILDVAFTDSTTLFLSAGNGDGTFKLRVSFNLGGSALGTSTGDVNGDGILDFLFVTSLNRVAILLGNGDGSFQPRLTFPTAVNGTGITAGDFNNDGVLDFIELEGPNNIANIYFGNGDASFKAPVSYAAGTYPRSVVLGDINGDGVTDFATGDQSGSTFSIFLGNGTPGAALSEFSLRTRTEALQALDYAKSARFNVLSALGDNGAQQSRLRTMINVLQIRTENCEYAASQILDVDVSEESANVVKNRIIRQAGTAILAQANIQPQIALTLLGKTEI